MFEPTPRALETAESTTGKLDGPRVPGADKGAIAEAGGPGHAPEGRDSCTLMLASGNGLEIGRRGLADLASSMFLPARCSAKEVSEEREPM